MNEIFPGVFEIQGRLATKNMTPGHKVYGEKIVKICGAEYRIWDVFRSKLAGAVKKGLKHFPFSAGQKVLYLGASTGTTISHLSDIVGRTGEIYAVEISPHPMKNLLQLCKIRDNIIPILADAGHPENYSDVGPVDVIYQDVAQPDQAGILLKNARAFLPKGYACLAIKSQSIDVTKSPSIIFEQVLAELRTHFQVVETYQLEPFDKDHLFALLSK